MAILSIGSTFDSLTNNFANGVVKLYNLADAVIDVFDWYDNPQSMKALERV